MATAGTQPGSHTPFGDIETPLQRAPLRVCLFIDSLGPDSGNELLVERLANTFDPQVIETHVCCFAGSKRLSNLRAHVRTAVFPLVRVNSASGLRQMGRFYRYLKQNRIDVIHSFMNNSAMFSVPPARAVGCRAVITSRLNCGYVYTRRLIRIFRVLNRFSTHVLANSAAARQVAREVEKIPADKISVFYPGVDLRQYDPRCGSASIVEGGEIPASAPVVGIVANFRAVKDLPLFLRAAAVVTRAVPGTAFLLVGREGPLKPDLEKLAAELGIAEHVFFSSPEVPVAKYLARMSVACLSSESESLPNAILEYMAMGLPVVATNVGGVGELVHDGVNGFLVRTRTAEAFAEPVIRLLQDSNLCAALGRQGLVRAQSEFEITASVKRLQQFYTEAVGSN